MTVADPVGLGDDEAGTGGHVLLQRERRHQVAWIACDRLAVEMSSGPVSRHGAGHRRLGQDRPARVRERGDEGIVDLRYYHRIFRRARRGIVEGLGGRDLARRIGHVRRLVDDDGDVAAPTPITGVPLE